MPDQAPNIEIKPGDKGRLVYDKNRRTIVSEFPAVSALPKDLPADTIAAVVGGGVTSDQVIKIWGLIRSAFLLRDMTGSSLTGVYAPEAALPAGCSCPFDGCAPCPACTAASAPPIKTAPLRLCGHCHSWNSKPCGEQCCWQPNDPLFTPSDPDMPDLRLCSFNYLADEMRRRGATVTPAPHGGDFCNG